ncbi:Putative oxidoreductase CatD [Corynebacterium occultum]|uniref:Oxidoreductase CatD n=1 Tax=Corynebacterium occultum TaxID=2675219 RepID=A0A6B8W316_9CORY|nr:DoxX family protein [Corynebacterium occultum]QGU06377.1 Putative oxidoreductase CatD [Corynebacterium occultum]
MSNIKEIALLLSRVLLGVILIAHGWDKFQITGLEGISGYFDSIGIPAASVAAPVVALIEIIGGALLILGLFTPIVGIVITLVMAGAAIFAHLPYGIFVGNGGWELVGAISAGTIALAALGAGRYSMDTLISARRSSTQQEATFA